MVAALLEDVRERLQGVVDAGGGCVRVREAGSVIRGERGDDFGVERDLSGGEEVAEEGVESLAEGSPRGGVRGRFTARMRSRTSEAMSRGVASPTEGKPVPIPQLSSRKFRTATRSASALLTPLAAADLTGRIASRHASPLPPDRDENDRRGSPRRRPGDGPGEGPSSRQPPMARSFKKFRYAARGRKPRERGVSRAPEGGRRARTFENDSRR